MESVRINVSIPKNVFRELSQEVESRKRSRFITEAIMRLVKEKRDQRLAAEYQEAAKEIRTINKELEGAINDGLD
jgi:metal-responsive CopG/Arc/MetJ family transcriptional regulator